MLRPKLSLGTCFLGLFGLVVALLLLFYFVSPKRNFQVDVNNPQEKAFVVVIPSYNNKDWYQRNLDSVFNQKYSNYRVIFIDDASPDGTGVLAKEYIQEKGQQFRTTLIQNQTRMGALANNYQAIMSCNPQEIIVEVDGDDWFYCDQILAYLNKMYSDPDVWVTYGQFVYYPGDVIGWVQEIPETVIQTNTYRQHRWLTTHLRTFYAGLFHKIKKEDLLLDGEFFSMAGDLAHMFPIIEMAGPHSRFIPDVLYVYNVATEMNDHIKDAGLQDKLGMIIRWRVRYWPVDKPW